MGVRRRARMRRSKWKKSKKKRWLRKWLTVVKRRGEKRKEYSTSQTSWFKRSPVSPASPDITVSFSQSSTRCSLSLSPLTCLSPPFACFSFDSHSVLAPLNEYNCNSQTVSFCSRRLLFARQTVTLRTLSSCSDIVCYHIPWYWQEVRRVSARVSLLQSPSPFLHLHLFLPLSLPVFVEADFSTLLIVPAQGLSFFYV